MMNTCVKQDGFEDFAKERTEVASFEGCGFRPAGESNESNQLVQFQGFLGKSVSVIEIYRQCCDRPSRTTLIRYRGWGEGSSKEIC